MRRAAKRDQNEKMIISALRAAGCKVMQLDKFDLLVQRGREKFMLEVKMPNGRIEKSQQAMIDEGWDLWVVHDVNEALNAVGIHDPRALNGLSFDL